MSERLKAAAPLAISVGILAVVWLEVSLNFSFHWVTVGNLGNGLALPANFTLVAPAALISWSMFFAAGADRAAAGKVAVASTIGAVGALLLGLIAPKIADLPNFYGIALTAGVLAVFAVLASTLTDYYYLPGVFCGLTAVLFWWIATGLDGWAPGGGGTKNTLAALASPLTSGDGSFHGVLSTPLVWVFISSAISLLIGPLLGLATVKLADILAHVMPQPAGVPAEQ